jgi:hypothetical protein
LRPQAVFALIGLLSLTWVRTGAEAQTVWTATDLELSGFADVIYSSSGEEGTDDHFMLSQVELDLAYLLSEKIRADLAIAHREGSFGIGAMTIGFSPAERIGICVGQFDVPFGIDYNFFPSPDRKLISAPLATETTHRLWNDIGLQLSITSSHVDLTLFAVNGLSDAEVTVVPGGRLSHCFGDLLEVGGSMALGFTDDSDVETGLYGIDFQLTHGGLYLKGEYIEHSWEMTTEGQSTAGFYLQATVDVDPFFFCARYGGLDSDEPELDELDRVTVGAGYRVIEQVELRGECQFHASGQEDDRLFLQTVASF